MTTHSRWALLAALAVALCVAGCQQKSRTFKGHKPAKIEHADEGLLNQVVLTDEAVKRLELQTEEASIKSVAHRRSVGGEVMAPPGRSAVITAPVPGVIGAPKLGKAPPLPGDKLKAGQLVLRLSPLVTPNQNLQAQVRRDLSQTRARALNARRQAERMRQLNQEGAGNVAAFEQADAQAQVAEAEQANAEARMAQLTGKNPLAADVKLPLRAPADSILMALSVAPGQAVSAGTELFRVASLGTVWIRVPVYVGDLTSLDRGKTAGIFSLGKAGAARRLEGRPLSVPAGGRPNTASAELFFEVDLAEHGLVPGQRVRVALPLLGDNSERLVVPFAALLYDQHGGTWVYTRLKDAKGNRFERARVELDYVDGPMAVLSRGPAPGTPVVTTGAIELFGTEFGTGK